MRLLLFADLHLDTPFMWARPRAARARRSALRDCLVRIAALADEAKVDGLCCAGDLYEQERFTPDTARFLRAVFAGLHPRPVFLAPGNHDWLGPASLYRLVDWTDNVHVFAEPRLTPVTLSEGLTLWGAAHCAPANTPGFFDDGFAVDRSGVHVALFHGSAQHELDLEASGKVPHAPFRPGQIHRSGLHHALVGHFHTPRDAPEHTYPGNPEPLTFGEQGPRGAVLMTVGADGSVHRERHTVATTEIHDVVVDLTGVSHSHEVRQRVSASVAGLAGFARVTLCGEVAPDVDVDLDDVTAIRDGQAPDSSATDGLEIVARVGDLTVAYDIEALARERTVRGQFVTDVLAATDLSGDQRRRVLITGLRALDGRHDLEVR